MKVNKELSKDGVQVLKENGILLIKGCPWCGKCPVLTKEESNDPQGVEFIFDLTCKNDKCKIKPSHSGFSGQEVIDEWNEMMGHGNIYAMENMVFKSLYMGKRLIPCLAENLTWNKYQVDHKNQKAVTSRFGIRNHAQRK